LIESAETVPSGNKENLPLGNKETSPPSNKEYTPQSTPKVSQPPASVPSRDSSRTWLTLLMGHPSTGCNYKSIISILTSTFLKARNRDHLKAWFNETGDIDLEIHSRLHM
jgi:hypothetical protein